MTVFPDIEVGDLVTADLLDSMLPKTFVKASATPRNTTTTLADDPELSGIALAVGTYEIEVVGSFSLTTTATQKIQTKWAFSGTWSGATTRRMCIGAGQTQTTAPTGVTEANLQSVPLTTAVVYDTAAGTGSGYTTFREFSGSVVVTGAGSFSLQWAQSASSGNNTTLQEDSYIRVRRVG